MIGLQAFSIDQTPPAPLPPVLQRIYKTGSPICLLVALVPKTRLRQRSRKMGGRDPPSMRYHALFWLIHRATADILADVSAGTSCNHYCSTAFAAAVSINSEASAGRAEESSAYTAITVSEIMYSGEEGVAHATTFPEVPVVPIASLNDIDRDNYQVAGPPLPATSPSYVYGPDDFIDCMSCGCLILSGHEHC